MAKEETRHGKTGRRLTIAAAAAAVLLLAGGGLTGGWGLLPGDGSSPQPDQTQTQAEQTVTASPAASGSAETNEAAEPDTLLTVRVHESQILFEDAPVTPKELEEQLLRAYSEGKEVELVNDGAIKADYDAAAAILDKLEIPYAVR